MRSPKSPKQLPSASKRSFPWQGKEQIAPIQFVALFAELKKEGSEWPTFGNRHEYWDKAAAFVQETAGTEFRRSGKSSSNSYLGAVQRGSKIINNFYLVYGLFSLCSN